MVRRGQVVHAAGESVTAPDGSIAWKYTNPYTWLDGSDRNQGSEVVMWAIELRTPLTVAPVPRGLYLVTQNISPPQTFPIPTQPASNGNLNHAAYRSGRRRHNGANSRRARLTLF